MRVPSFTWRANGGMTPDMYIEERDHVLYVHHLARQLDACEVTRESIRLQAVSEAECLKCDSWEKRLFGKEADSERCLIQSASEYVFKTH